MSVTKSNRKIVSLNAGSDPTVAARVTVLENNAYKVTYYAVISGASGTITPPTNATFNAGEFAGLNCVLSEIDGSNKPTYISPKTAGGVIVTATLNTTTGAWAASGTYTSGSIALIYSIKITAVNYSNLTYANILETVQDFNVIISGSFPVTLTATAQTNVTLPTTGTLSTLAGTEVITNKDLTSLTNTFPFSSLLPVYSGKQRFLPYNTITTSTAVHNTVWYVPYYVGKKHTVTSVTLEVTTASAATNIKVALYADNNGVPGALIEASGDLSAATTGDKTYTFASPISLTSQVYWCAAQISSTAIGVRFSTSLPTMIYQGGNGTGNTYKETQSYGTFPTNATPVSVNSSGIAVTLTPQ